MTFESGIKHIEINLDFSDPEIVPYGSYVIVRLNESDLNRMDSGRLILPVNLSVFELPFGTEIIVVEYKHSAPIIYNITKKIAFTSMPGTDKKEIYSALGWLELRFLQLCGEEHYDCLGENHGEVMTAYLHRFPGDEARMDVKMVQQWELFGDPILKIGRYD